MGKRGRLTVYVVILFCCSALVYAADPGHSAPAISSGIFDSGDFTFQNDLFVSNNLGVGTTSASETLEVAGNILMSGGTQDYLILDRSSFLAFQSRTSGSDFGMELFTKDGDATDDVLVSLYGYGMPPTDVDTDRERLVIGYSSTDREYQIYTEEAGVGDLRNISIFTEGWYPQLFVGSDGRIGIRTVRPQKGFDVNATALFRGNITVMGNLTVLQDLSAPRICLAGDCRTVWPSGGGGLWTQDGSDIYYDTGLVGIGTGVNPNATLHIVGEASSPVPALRIQNGTGNITFEVNATSGEVCINGDCRDAWPTGAAAGSVGYFFDKTTASYDGDLDAGGKSGYEAGDYICDQEFSGTHFCHAFELMRTYTGKDVSTITGWAGNAWFSSDMGAKYAPATVPFNDCKSWTDSTDSFGGNFYIFDQDRHGAVTCDASKPLACCKVY